ncbi:hypothetical protein A2851_02745 [Candidatus Kaiserbacteria bacterium RIFCSPHIGHO2_01_FULL_53_29]|uniref:Major facilitator superfamily (MFS) profile domain-containing protein n=1 Tax=Candidatus Kaiserbacteria bacterium RIFCSPHIGHO2_01_FULL_53_29 TaxID=1798480 RepID=A0A1F6CVL7_9BACT|nr:MAG: hypothetical protein A2851_02745 [Candidatus Kaiserbacteria bacterium RIFCSPHIGHO2_01_FULL_53_29]
MSALDLHRFLLRFALAGVNVFAWIFVFQYFYLIEPSIAHALARVALLYALSQMITCLLTPYAARALRKGARRMLILAVLVAASALVALGSTFAAYWSVAYVPLGVAAFAIALGIYRALYFVPYEIEALVAGPARRGMGTELFIALAPLAVGLFIVSTEYGPIWIMYIGATVVALSALPLLYLREIHEGYSWGYRETFVQLLARANRPAVTHAFLEGISGAALLLFWPIAVFLIAGWSYGMLGVILTLTFLVAILSRTLVRKGVRRAGLHQSRPLNVIFAATPWLFRMLVGTPLGVVVVDSYFFTTTPRRTGLDPLTFEQFADAGTYVDEYTALKEMALALGKTAACILGAILALLASVPVALVCVFIAAALASVTVALRPR